MMSTLLADSIALCCEMAVSDRRNCVQLGRGRCGNTWNKTRQEHERLRQQVTCHVQW
jgi:hypothetical protein